MKTPGKNQPQPRTNPGQRTEQSDSKSSDKQERDAVSDPGSQRDPRNPDSDLDDEFERSMNADVTDEDDDGETIPR